MTAKRRMESEGGSPKRKTTKKVKKATAQTPDPQTTNTNTTKNENLPCPKTSSLAPNPHTSYPSPNPVAATTSQPPSPEKITPSLPEESRKPSKKKQQQTFLEGDQICHVAPSDVGPCLSTQRKRLRPLLRLEEVDGHRTDQPDLFKDAPVVTTFVRVAEGQTPPPVWKMLEAAEGAIPNVRLADWKHPSLKTLKSKCQGRVPVYTHPSLYRALKLRYPLDVGGFTRTGQFSPELCTSSLGQAVGVLTPEDFRSVVDTE